MIDIPIGICLVPVETDDLDNCFGCCFAVDEQGCMHLDCNAEDRKDDKNVVFKLVDYPVKEEK